MITTYSPVRRPKRARMTRIPPKPDENPPLTAKTKARMTTIIVDLGARNELIPGGS